MRIRKIAALASSDIVFICLWVNNSLGSNAYDLIQGCLKKCPHTGESPNSYGDTLNTKSFQ